MRKFTQSTGRKAGPRRAVRPRAANHALTVPNAAISSPIVHPVHRTKALSVPPKYNPATKHAGATIAVTNPGLLRGTPASSIDEPDGLVGDNERGGWPMFHAVTMPATGDDVERISVSGRNQPTSGLWGNYRTLG
jgi:hypothetical protein